MIDHCITRLKSKRREEAYQNYVTECLRMISENTAKFAGGKYMSVKFSSLFSDEKKRETRSEEEIKNHIKGKLAQLEEN